MKRASPLERISDALGGEQELRRMRNFFGIPNFCYKSPIGWMDIIAEENRILRVSFSETPPLSEARVWPNLPVLARTVELLDRYFNGQPINFAEILVELIYFTDFQQHVWKIIQQIPYGEVRTYQWIANQMGRPKSARAVGNATGANPVPILIPCHRVIGSNGRLGGYGGGIEKKCQLLALERYPVEMLK